MVVARHRTPTRPDQAGRALQARAAGARSGAVVIPRRVKLAFLTGIGDDGTGPMWQRLSHDGLQVLAMAAREARDLGHPCTADEHVLLGLLRHGTSATAALLRDQGLDLATARAALLEVGPTVGPRADPAGALRSVGIDVDQVRRRL